MGVSANKVYALLVPTLRREGVLKQAVFTMRLDPEHHRQAREYDDYLRRKVEVGRASMCAGLGRSNEEVEARFAAKRESY